MSRTLMLLGLGALPTCSTPEPYIGSTFHAVRIPSEMSHLVSVHLLNPFGFLYFNLKCESKKYRRNKTMDAQSCADRGKLPTFFYCHSQQWFREGYVTRKKSKVNQVSKVNKSFSMKCNFEDYFLRFFQIIIVISLFYILGLFRFLKYYLLPPGSVFRG